MTEPASVYLDLREAITLLVPSQHGMAPTEELPHVWGVMIDVGLPPGPVVAIADGTTSLYLGNGGARVGAGGLPHVAALARELLAAVDAAVGAGALAPDWRFPGAGHGPGAGPGADLPGDARGTDHDGRDRRSWPRAGPRVGGRG